MEYENKDTYQDIRVHKDKAGPVPLVDEVAGDFANIVLIRSIGFKSNPCHEKTWTYLLFGSQSVSPRQLCHDVSIEAFEVEGALVGGDAAAFRDIRIAGSQEI